MNNMYDILTKMNLLEGRGSKPDFLDLDKDGDRKEPMKSAAKEVDEASYSAKAARAGKDIGKPGKAFAKIAGDAAKRYGSKERGEKVAGAVLAKLRAKESIDEADMEEGNEFSGELAKARATGAKEFKVDGKSYKVTKEEDEKMMNEDVIEEGFVEFMDRKAAYRSIGADVDGKSDDYVVTFKDGTRKRYQETERGRRVTTLEPVERPEEVDADGEVVKRGRGRPKGTGRKMGARGKTRVSEQDLDEDSYPFPVKQTPAGPVVDNRLLAQKILTVASELGPKSQGMMSKMLRPGQTQAAEAVTELGEWLARAFNDQAGTEGAQLVDMMKNPTGPYAKYGDAYNSLLLALKKRGIDLQAAADGIKNWSALLKGAAQQAMAEDYDKDEYDEEGEMAKSQARTIADAAMELHQIVGDNENLPEWVQKKIALAQEYIDTARDYLAANRPEEEMMAEKAVSKAQRAAAGIAYAAKKGDIPKSELRGASKEMAKMDTKELKKFAKTKEKGLPEKKKEESVEETTVAGSVATAPAETKKSKGGIQFGKGVYEGQIAESFEKKLGAVLNEGMTINASVGEDGQKSLTVSATDEDAEHLAAILKMAGVGSSQKGSCDSCGQTPCGCESLEEELANAPDEEYADTDTLVNKLSGGLNARKTTGQTTGAPFNRDPARMGAMHQSQVDEAQEKKLFDLYKQFKG